MAKSTIEKIASVEEQIQQLENARKKLIQQQKDADRKARTKRLIERGAILESLIDKSETLTNEQIKAFLEKTAKTEFALKTLADIITPPPAATDTKTEIAGKKAE